MAAPSGTTVSQLLVTPIADEHREEALAFLSRRPLQTVIMGGLLRDYGVTVPTPRGSFYGCRDRLGELEGVALIGRATMFEVRAGRALVAFAELARNTPAIEMVMGEEEELRQFLTHYVSRSRGPRRYCRELFYEFTPRAKNADSKVQLRRATLDDLDQIVSAHAQMVVEESGVNPLSTDPTGFRERCARRVRRGHVWTLLEKGELVFKTDVVTTTPEAAYIEGVWVRPDRRSAGLARRCWTELSKALLKEWPTFCGFANAENPAAKTFYEKMGGVLVGRYDKVYL